MTDHRDFEVEYGGRRMTVTAYPPIDVAQGTAWWVRIDDNWIKVRDLRPSESDPDTELSDDVRAFVRDLFLRKGGQGRA